MPFNPANAAPGVYVFEQPSGVRTITGVATSITAFIGSTPRGLVDTPTMVTSYADYLRAFVGPNTALAATNALSNAVSDFFLNGGSQAIIVRVYAPAAAPVGGGTPPNNYATLTVGGLSLQASSQGPWGNNLSATTQDHTQTKNPSNTRLFNLSVVENDQAGHPIGSPESFINVSTDPNDPRYIRNVLVQDSTLVRLADGAQVPNQVTSATATVADTGKVDADHVVAIGDTQIIGDPVAKTGLHALDTVDLVNLLYIPPYTSTNDVSANVIGQAASYCESRRAFLIIDSPSTWTSANTAEQGMADPGAHLGTTSDHAAAFFPRVKKLGQTDYTTAGGIIAGIFARTDAQRGVWKAPAGVDAVLTGVGQLSVALNDGDNGILNSLGLNCLRSFPVTGRVVWGARTLQGADRIGSEYKYIPIRRTALYIEESLYRGLQWVVFEPNDEPLWAQIRLNVGAFMNTLFRQGAFQGKTPRDAYFVKCDKETTTQNDIDRGIVNIVVGFAPLKPAEFVVVTIEQMAGQLQV